MLAKLSFIASVMLFVAGLLHAQSGTVVEYTDCPADKKLVWDMCFGEHESSDGEFQYVGQWENNKPHGVGEIFYADDDSYKGEFSNGFSHGKGVYTFSYGDQYTGEFVNDKFQGFGTYTFADGTFYEGDFLNDAFHGQGKFVWKNDVRIGDIYIGEFKNNKRTGNGEYTFAKTIRGQIRRALYACCGLMG
jgi:hypothetical protein